MTQTASPSTPFARLALRRPSVANETKSLRLSRRSRCLWLLLRTLTVAALFVGFSAQALAGWTIYEGAEEQLCKEVHARLNRYSYPDPSKHANSCDWNVLMTYPGFTEPPWIELEPLKYEELLYRLLRYQDAGGHIEQFVPAREHRIRAEAQEFIKSGGRIQLWRTRLISDFYSRPDAIWAPPGPQNVIQLRYPAHPVKDDTTGRCPRVPVAAWAGGSLYIANDELTDVHPDLGNAGFVLLGMTLVRYQDESYFLSGTNHLELAIGNDRGSGPGSNVCRFFYTHSPKRK